MNLGTSTDVVPAAHRSAAHPDAHTLAPAPGGCIDAPALEAILLGGLARIPLYHGIAYGTLRAEVVPHHLLLLL